MENEGDMGDDGFVFEFVFEDRVAVSEVTCVGSETEHFSSFLVDTFY